MQARNERLRSTGRRGWAVLVLAGCAAAMLWLPLPAVASFSIACTAGPTTVTPEDVSDTTGEQYLRFTNTTAPYTVEVTGSGIMECLVVGGGGGGGKGESDSYDGGGGGGAGGLVWRSCTVSNGEQYEIRVGSGGAGSTTYGINGVNGQDSYVKKDGTYVFQALGGGGGGSENGTAGATGGSGGGGGGSHVAAGAGGAGTPGQGCPGAPGSSGAETVAGWRRWAR